MNGSDTRLQNMAAAGLAKGFRLPGIGGSDCHSAAEVGRAATQFHVPVTDQATFMAALRSGAYEAVAIE
ncbi:MAG: PHP-associated domain-containing protein [Dehalococcoidia bacterium]|nr:PHP-associated domain-containing protein [Dehalococcoidia bacterium]